MKPQNLLYTALGFAAGYVIFGNKTKGTMGATYKYFTVHTGRDSDNDTQIILQLGKKTYWDNPLKYPKDNTKVYPIEKLHYYNKKVSDFNSKGYLKL